MKKISIVLCSACLFTIVTLRASAQPENKTIREANKLYKKGDFGKALPEYRKAVQQNPNNPVAKYNLASAQFRNNKFEEAEKTFSDANAIAPTDAMKEKTVYNKGVALSKQKKLLESIEAYKDALKLDPSDEDARFNLQKALEELRKQNQSNQEKQPQPQKKNQRQKEQPQPRQTNLDKRKIEQYLQSLQQKEQEVQRKIQQNRQRAVTKPEKDW